MNLVNLSTILHQNKDIVERLYKKWIVSKEAADDIPCVADMYDSITVFHKVILYFSIVPCLIVCTLGFFHIYGFIRYTKNEEMHANLYFIIMVPPITVAASLLGMFIPRAAGFLYAVITTYYMLSLYMILDLLYLLFGGRTALALYLEKNSMMISLAVPPYTCCCTFLPDLKPTLDNFLRIDACILQTVIVRVLMQVCELVTYFELRSKNHVDERLKRRLRDVIHFIHNLLRKLEDELVLNDCADSSSTTSSNPVRFFTLSNLTNIVSMYISLYFGYVLVNAGKDKLEPPFRAGVLFKLHDYLLSAPAILKLILDIAVAMEWIGPQKLMPADSMAMFYFNFLLILLNLAISFYATYVFRPTQMQTSDDAQKNKKPGSFSSTLKRFKGRLLGMLEMTPSRQHSTSLAKNSTSLGSPLAGEESVPHFVLPRLFPPA